MSDCHGYWGLRGTVESSYYLILKCQVLHLSLEMWKFFICSKLPGRWFLWIWKKFPGAVSTAGWMFFWLEWRDTGHNCVLKIVPSPFQEKGQVNQSFLSITVPCPVLKSLINLILLHCLLVRGAKIVSSSVLFVSSQGQRLGPTQHTVYIDWYKWLLNEWVNNPA